MKITPKDLEAWKDDVRLVLSRSPDEVWKWANRFDRVADDLEEAREALRNIVANAVLVPEMSDATDIYAVPMDDIEAVSAVLEGKSSG